jgi:hypothetical protein
MQTVMCGKFSAQWRSNTSRAQKRQTSLAMPRIRHIAGWKVAICASAAGAVLFVAFGGFSSGYSLRSVALLAVSGGLLGAIAAPDLEPEAFRHAKLWQMFFAILGSVLVAFHVNAEPVGYLIAVVVGAVLGYFARYWTKHINVP